MSQADHTNGYPRQLTAREREWMTWLLPAEKAGYREYAEALDRLIVVGEGRRGRGEIILGLPGTVPDLSGPLAPVFAYGVIETTFGTISVTLRDRVNDQVSAEIVSQRADEVPDEFEDARRWTYSTWTPGDPCPQCLRRLRTAKLLIGGGSAATLAICTADRRLWINDSRSGVNRLIPVTNFYNELMLHKNVRDPKIALDSQRLFADLGSFTDQDLARAFETYNTMKTKIHRTEDRGAPEKTGRGLRDRVRRILFKP